MKRFLLPALALLFAALCAAVFFVQRAQRAAARGEDGGDAAAAAPEPVPVVAAESPRLASLSPGFTELLCDLGLGGHLVGRTAWCTSPPYVAGVPEVVGPDGSLDLDALEAVRPDWVLVPAALADAGVHEALASRRLNHLSLRTDPLSEFYQSVFEIGTRFGAEKPAAFWLERMDALTSELHERAAADCSARGAVPAVLLVLSRVPGTNGAPDRLRVAGRGACHHGFLEALGVRNACPAEGVAAEMTPAEAARLAPDVLVEIVPDPSRAAAVLSSWIAPGTLCPAVLGGDVHVVSDRAPLHPGPALEGFFEDLASFVHSWAGKPAPPALP